MNKRVAILYFTGAGSTKKIANLIYKNISLCCETDIFPIEKAKQVDLNLYDGIIIGTPVYHGTPAKILMDYFKDIKPLKKTSPVFIYNTYALGSFNTNRILAKLLKTKNMVTVIDREYRSPASDGALIAPFIKRFYKFEKNLNQNVKKDCIAYLKKIKYFSFKGYIPKFRFSSIINAPNKFAGQCITFPIYLHKHKCSKCKICMRNCPYKAIKIDEFGYPVINIKKCENCYRCIHHCPNKTLSLSKKRTPKKLLKYK